MYRCAENKNIAGKPIAVPIETCTAIPIFGVYVAPAMNRSLLPAIQIVNSSNENLILFR
jgi:hypothetical protein